MFYEPQPTRYDLNFHLFGFPVRIHPFFWLLTVFLGANFGGPALVLWVLAVTFSILTNSSLATTSQVRAVLMQMVRRLME